MKYARLMTSAAVLALLTGPAIAQDATTGPGTGAGAGVTAEVPLQPEPLFSSMEEMTVGNMVGMIVYGPSGARIGEIDYVVATEDGYAGVIGIGGFLGLGEYTVAIALEDFVLNEDGMSFTVNAEKEVLQEMPEFDETGVEGLPAETPLAELLFDAGGDDTGVGGANEMPLESTTTTGS